MGAAQLLFSQPAQGAFGAMEIFQYFDDSNFAGKVIVILLVIFSLVAWSVMLGKWSDLKEMKSLNCATESRLSKSPGALEALASARGMKGPYAALLNEAVAAWGRVDSSDLSPEMLAVRMGHVENALQRAVGRQSMKYESKMVLLGSIISGAPFLGLLGTVWGVMDSFGSMGKEGASVTLQMLAPGVSGALLTTVAGLVVAIPSVFGYNFLLTLSRGMVLDLENFASSLADRIELETREMASRRRGYEPLSRARADAEAPLPASAAPASTAEPGPLSDMFGEPVPQPEPIRFDLDADAPDTGMPPRNYD